MAGETASPCHTPRTETCSRRIVDVDVKDGETILEKCTKKIFSFSWGKQRRTKQDSRKSLVIKTANAKLDCIENHVAVTVEAGCIFCEQEILLLGVHPTETCTHVYQVCT